MNNKQFPSKDSKNDKKGASYNHIMTHKGCHYCYSAAYAVGTLSMSHPNICLEISSPILTETDDDKEAIIINQG